MAYRSSTIISLATATDAVISVPSSVQSDDIVVVCVYIENNTKTITPDTGFTQKYGPDSVPASHHTYWFWKRLTAADSGSYTFSWTGAEPRQAVAVAFSGRVTSGDPFGAGTHQSSALGTTAFPDLSITAEEGADAIAMYSAWNSGTLTSPTGFTGRQNTNEVGLSTKDNVTAGTLAASSATWSVTSDLLNRLAVLKKSDGQTVTWVGYIG